MMKYPAHKYPAQAIFCILALLPVPSALAALPQRDLSVELRQVEEGGAGYVVNTESRTPLLETQQVQVRNGEKATLSVGRSMPLQWVQSVAEQHLTQAASGLTGSGAAVVNAVTWMDAGQTIKVHPRWPGGKQPVVADVEIQLSKVDERAGAELPNQARSQIVTTVSAPLGQWVTIAASGSKPQPGVYGSEGARTTRLLLQIRMQTAR